MREGGGRGRGREGEKENKIEKTDTQKGRERKREALGILLHDTVTGIMGPFTYVHILSPLSLSLSHTDYE